MFRFLSGILVITLILSLLSFQAYASGEETSFVVTAYYSPLPGQIRYTTGSFAGDVRLNGEWVTTASGNWVFPGLLAGPANYPFGTKIYFKWYGVGVVEDRGWAIVKAWERGHSFDRIDIWMGYGDEWLSRALSWGTRTIEWKIVVPSAQVSINFGESTIGTLTKLDVNPESNNTQDIKKLQEIFVKADLYDGQISGRYNDIQDILIDFQIDNNIISSINDISAGWYGPKTISALRKTYGNNTTTLLAEDPSNFDDFNHKQASEIYKIILEYGDLQVNPDSSQETVRDLQELMTQLWEYKGSIDGNYSSIEIPLIELQKKIGLIKETDDWGAGYFGNKTKSALWVYYEQEDNIDSNDEWSLPAEKTQTKTIENKLVVPQEPSVEKEQVIVAQLSPDSPLAREEQVRLFHAFQKLKTTRWESFVTQLLSQIDAVIPVIEDNDIKEKLLYIQEISK